MPNQTEYMGLGFPIVLENAPTRDTPHGRVLAIDHRKLHQVVFQVLTSHQGEFSGAHVKFVRQYMKLTQEQFADILRVDRSSVAKWEGRSLEPAGMKPSIMMLIRLIMARHEWGVIDDTSWRTVERASRGSGIVAMTIDARRLAA